MFSVLLGLLSFRINYARVLHTGRLPLKFPYGALYVCACGISFYIPNYCSLISRTHQSNHQSASAYLHSIFIGAPYQTIVALSAELTKATTKVHSYWMSSAYLHSIFIGALPPPPPPPKRHKWKNHFSEMKGDIGMSLHEKEGEQDDA